MSRLTHAERLQLLQADYDALERRMARERRWLNRFNLVVLVALVVLLSLTLAAQR